jgi:hypothetical protein
LQDPNADSGSKAGFFPTRHPLPSTKLAAARGSDRSIHLFYQATEGSIQELAFYPGRGWSGGDSSGSNVVEPAVAKHGSPLTAVAGGWTELRLFYVDTADLLKEVYSDDHTKWTNSNLPPYSLDPTAMISAVAWNYASPFFQIRVYTAAHNDDLLEISYSRNSGGWSTASPESVSTNLPEAVFRTGSPLSAVAAVLVGCETKIKVYLHPKRIIIAEWEVCDKVIPPLGGIRRPCVGAAERRRIEEETRKAIAEEERRKEEELRRIEEEKERQRQEELKRAEEQKQKEEQQQAEVAKEQRKQDKIKLIGGCSQGYAWKKVEGGYRCDGGGHFVSDAQLEED